VRPPAELTSVNEEDRGESDESDGEEAVQLVHDLYASDDDEEELESEFAETLVVPAVVPSLAPGKTKPATVRFYACGFAVRADHGLRGVLWCD
jgi:hypothetical protein